MGLPENILLALFDKLLIGLLLAVVGLWINRNLEQIKAYLALRNVIAPLRATSYGSLWKVTEKLTPRDSLIFSGNQKSVVLNELRDWYYEKGNACTCRSTLPISI